MYWMRNGKAAAWRREDWRKEIGKAMTRSKAEASQKKKPIARRKRRKIMHLLVNSYFNI
jgi:hypothetical protein